MVVEADDNMLGSVAYGRQSGHLLARGFLLRLELLGVEVVILRCLRLRIHAFYGYLDAKVINFKEIGHL